ncbi:MAG: sigma 54-interacting transcriptional regulator [Labilithrix sp.]|nr:sigma 54-interacting transcriptional regulator [Labilithrix sp.]MCW5810341.1 sigma 54-interacting transcriptional regulator [Labilithrix sp.]
MTDDLFAHEATRAKHANPLHIEKLRAAVETGRLRIMIERAAGRTGAQELVYEGDLCRIGSHVSNDVVVEDPTVSRFHCRIARGRSGWTVVDSGSTNGTRINGVKVLSAELEDEGVISLGDSILRVRPDGRRVLPEVPVLPSFGALVGGSGAMQRLFDILERVASSEIDVLIQGESGTGKELVATEVVQRSPRGGGPLVVVDCGALSPSLVESELFGHVRGAFTGADRDREGAFEAADGGTVFLDEIGELPLELQPKLLRALESREVRRVGQTRTIDVDVRVIAATHRDLEREVNRGRFREDLYYRLAKVAVRIPPLRDRLEDVPALVRSFLAAMGARDVDGVVSTVFPSDVLAQMQSYEWPGNVRELRNYIERRTVLGDVLPPRRVAEAAHERAPSSRPSEDEPALPFRAAKERAVEQFERSYIEPLLERAQGNVSKAAREARMDRMYLHQLAQKYGIRTAPKKAAGAGT